MKKFIVGALLAMSLASPVVSSAQTLTQEQINAQLQTVLNQLLLQVMDLMKQLTAMQAQQATDSQKIAEIQTSVVASPAPVLGVASTPSTSVVSFGTPICDQFHVVSVPIVISGSDWNSGKAFATYFDGWLRGTSGTTFEKPTTSFNFEIGKDFGTTTIKVELGNKSKPKYVFQSISSFEETMYLGDVCQ